MPLFLCFELFYCLCYCFVVAFFSLALLVVVMALAEVARASSCDFDCVPLAYFIPLAVVLAVALYRVDVRWCLLGCCVY